MNLVLLLPAALAALAALLMPLLLHLARRQQQVPTTFAALRWLRARPKPRRRIRFDEWLLLALRLLLVALAALWLARPAVLGVPDLTPWTVVLPGIDAGTVSDLPAEGERRWLAPGFPALEQPAPAGTVPVSSLLRELDADLPAGAALTVVVPERLAGVDAERPRLSRDVAWRVVAGNATPPPAAAARAPLLVEIRHDADHRGALRFLRAAVLAWQDDAGAVDGDRKPRVSDDGSAAPGAGVELLAWLRAGPLPPAIRDWVAKGRQVLLVAGAAADEENAATTLWRDAVGAPLLVSAPLGDGRILRFVRPLEPSAMPQLLEADFPRRLRDVLQPVATPMMALARDHVPLGDAASWPQAPRELRGWLALLIAALVLVERWLATSRKRWSAA